MKVESNTVVSIHYKLRNSQSAELLDQRDCSFLWGYAQVLPAVEEFLQNKTKGFRGDLTLSPQRAYGLYRQELVVEVPKDTFAPELPLKEGLRFNTVGPNGEPIIVQIVDVKEQSVVLDGNHPLAGLELHFQIELIDVRPATEEELRVEQVLPTASPLH